MAAVKPSMRDAFDPDVVETLVNQTRDEIFDEGEMRVHPLDDIEVTKHVLEDGFKWFTDMFSWKPKLFDDIPVRMFVPEDWDKEAQPYIPEIDPNWVWNKQAAERFALAMYTGDTTLLYGLQGTGKSCLAEQWCAMTNTPFWRMNCNRETREGHFLGSPEVDYNEEGQMYIKQAPTMLTESLKYGGLFCEDEAFRHSAALVLQSLREKSQRFVLLPDAPGRSAADRKLVAPEGRWWYVLTDNTAGLGDETGTFDAQVQDVSTLDRIDTVIEMHYLKPAEEKRILKKHSNLNDTIIEGMCDVAKLVRSAFRNQKMNTTMSVRGLLAWAAKTELTGDIGKALNMAWADKIGTEDRVVVKDIYHQVFSRKLEG